MKWLKCSTKCTRFQTRLLFYHLKKAIYAKYMGPKHNLEVIYLSNAGLSEIVTNTHSLASDTDTGDTIPIHLEIASAIPISIQKLYWQYLHWQH